MIGFRGWGLFFLIRLGGNEVGVGREGLVSMGSIVERRVGFCMGQGWLTVDVVAMDEVSVS